MTFTYNVRIFKPEQTKKGEKMENTKLNKEQIMKEFMDATKSVISKEGLQNLILKTAKEIQTRDKFIIADHLWNKYQIEKQKPQNNRYYEFYTFLNMSL